MSHSQQVSKREPAEDAAVDLGRWLGRREAFGLIAGRCSAAEAESLRRIRDDRAYLQFAATWAEFCERRLGLHPRKVQRTLRLLEEFGPRYFHVAQMAHVTPDEYRAIAPNVGEDGIRVDGAVVALLPENGEQVSAAVAELLRRKQPAIAKTAVRPAAAVARRCESAAEALEGVEDRLTPEEKLAIGRQICRLFAAANRRGMWLAP